MSYKILDYFKTKKIVNQTITFKVPVDYSSTHPNPPLIDVTITITQKYDKTFHSEKDGFEEIILPENPNLMLYLQGGPGFGCNIPTDYSGMTKVLLDEGYQIVWLDQRGTGLSTPLDCLTRKQNTPANKYYDKLFEYLIHFRADSIVKDAEHIRKILIGDNKWSLLGQSYGGFCCFTYLSFYSDSIKQVLITGGVPPIGKTVDDVYTQTYKRTEERNIHYYNKYPQDIERVIGICDYLERNHPDVILPNGGTLSVERFQQLGLNFGATGGTDKIHSIVTKFHSDLKQFKKLSLNTLTLIQDSMSFDTNNIYAFFQEAIYCDGNMKSNWSADRLRYAPGNETFTHNTDIIYFTGEMVYKSMFTDYTSLREYRSLADKLHDYENWSQLYDIDKLKSITWDQVPIVAATYYSDQYVDFKLTEHVKNNIVSPDNLRQFITNEFFHNGLRANPEKILGSLFKLLDDDID
ncbi:hypothetical protein KGF54_003245 [Candida jiufengensis]|uniref:uncharacterized protein n=1 Tax=Candida jiufengensis TaxID=497108 RepID=UPI00222431BE|nr:uncharacterized protein KGF54_003245 [Candida jiufengensis]KAI5952378.1 hypothetical protein KGF54_003245 [Candida jiufengensis]